ncbi:MAG TPA: hypothetical protein DFR83_14450, partial [Deltaproteobacteria bacterium]|nr:hypothetical protein [Deltaproteobacteria bacterium]
MVEHLGAGTFSDVWGVIDTRLDIERAVKVLRSGVDEALGTQLGQEAKVLARVSHPAVVHVYDVFQEMIEGAPRTCVVMERCDESLGARVVREGPLDERRALEWFDQLADGLARAHALGVVHRDVKPHNILLVDGHARLADFGLALFGSAVDVATRTSAVVGTVAFMSESVRKGEPHTPASDRYGLAASLVYAVTGVLPGDLLRRDNRVELSPAIRQRVEAWLQLSDQGTGPQASLPRAGVLASVVAVVGFAAGAFVSEPQQAASVDAAVAAPSEPLADCPTAMPTGRRQTFPSQSAHARLPEEGSSAAVGDFDGDSHVDLAVGFQLGSELRIWWGGPTGPDLESEPLVIPADHRSDSLRSGDLDGDGTDELVWLPRQTPGIHWTRFSSRDTVPDTQVLGVPDFPTMITVLDHTGDGCMDVLFLRPGAQEIAVRPSDCDSGWAAQESLDGRWRAIGRTETALVGIATDEAVWSVIEARSTPSRLGRRLHWGRNRAGRLEGFDHGERCRAPQSLEILRKVQSHAFADFNQDGAEDWLGVRSCGYCTSAL